MKLPVALFCVTLFAIFQVNYLYCETIIRTIAGTPFYGGDGKLAIDAQLFFPYGVTVSSRNELFIVDESAHTVRKVDKYGIISTVAGLGSNGFSGDGGKATDAQLNYPKAVAVKENGEILIADTSNNAIRIVDKFGTIHVLAGGHGFSGQSGDGGLAVDAIVDSPSSVAYSETTGDTYISEYYACAIRKVFANGTITTIAGKRNQCYGTYSDGINALEAILRATSIHLLDNELYISDYNMHAIRKVYLNNGTIVTVAGTGACNYNSAEENVLATTATICYPKAISVIPQSKEVIIGDSLTVRKVLTNQTLITIAGNRKSTDEYSGDYGQSRNAVFHSIYGVFAKDDTIYIADSGNRLIRKIDSNGIIQPVAGRYITASNLTRFKNPGGVYVTSSGREIFVADTANHVIKRVQVDTGVYSIVAGVVGNSIFNGYFGNATKIHLNAPSTLAMDEQNRKLYFCEANNNLIRMIDLRNGTVSTIAGNKQNINIGPKASQFSLNYPTGIYLNNQQKELLIADSLNFVIRKVFLQNETIIISAGQLNSNGNTGDGGQAVNAKFTRPLKLTVSSVTGNTYIADQFTVRKIFKNGTIISILQVNSPIQSIAVNSIEEVFVGASEKILKLLSNGTAEQLIGGPQSTANNFGGEDRELKYARIDQPTQMQITTSDVLYFADSFNHVIRKIAPRCKQYSFEESFSQELVYLTYELKRFCAIDSEHFLLENLPLIDMKFKSSNNSYKTIVANWNQKQYISVVDQFLDLVDVSWKTCSERNCSYSNNNTSAVIGTVPTNSNSNFLFFPSITSTIFVNYFRSSSNYIRSLQIALQFYNTQTNQFVKTEIVEKGLVDTIITGLNHSTLYQVYITSHVIYTYDLEFISSAVIIPVLTQQGILPSSSVTLITLQRQSDSFLLQWEEISMEQQGNLPITHLQIEISSPMLEIQSLQSIPYNALENSPASQLILFSSLPSNSLEYIFQIRACSSIGCGNTSDIIVGKLDALQVANNSIAVAVVIPLFLICCGCCIIIVFIILLLVIIAMLVTKKKSTFPKFTNIELLEQSKEFQIDESKLDFSNSISLGNGASGSVFTANYFNMQVAVKLINKVSMGVENDLTDFYNELKFLQTNTQHENIIRFFGAYQSTEQQALGLVMEYCPNGTVANYITLHKQLNFNTKVELLLGIANGMQYLHFHHIAHRDLKCENILLNALLIPKIIDFGFSREMSEKANRSLNLTMNIGTAAYCAPEVIKLQLQPMSELKITEEMSSNQSNYSQISQKQNYYDKQCDVYSFGIIIFVVYFQNKNPYGNMKDNQILYQISKDPNNFRPKVEESTIAESEKWLINLMYKCWDGNPERRPSFEEIYTKLQKEKNFCAK